MGRQARGSLRSEGTPSNRERTRHDLDRQTPSKAHPRRKLIELNE